MSRSSLAADLALGAFTGLLAAWVMEQAQTALSKPKQKLSDWLDPEEAEGGDESPATEQAADRAVMATTGEPLPEPARAPGGTAVHYATGAGLGVLYALLARRWSAVTAGFGVGYGLAVALVLDETIVPALRLAPPPHKTPPSTHLYGLAAHAVFGAALEGSRRAMVRHSQARPGRLRLPKPAAAYSAAIADGASAFQTSRGRLAAWVSSRRRSGAW
ncbi:MAG TPA: DUF1440 domain-containing protein [Caulobacteraceae bacterium]|jgi:hypothetical protein